MVTTDSVMALVRARVNRILTIAQASLPDSQFTAFRKLVLDEFGRSGLESDIGRLLQSAAKEESQPGPMHKVADRFA